MAGKKKSPAIVIVEDESIVALDIRNHLDKLGYSVSGIFSSGEEVLKHIEELSPDLVLMDIKLQGKLDGIETSLKIREKIRIPVVLLTAFADPGTIERAKQIGPFGYIIKPFESRELYSTIETALYRADLDRKLFESEEKYRKLFEDDLSADLITDADGNIMDYNLAFQRIFELNGKNITERRSFSELFPDNQSGEKILSDVRNLKRIELLELNLRTFKGKELTILANLIGSFRDGEFTGLKCYLIDITQRKSLEKQLRQSQKMEAIGRLAGGVAHDFNNILTVIFGYVSIMEENEKIKENIRSELDGLKAAASRASTLTRQLLAFSRRQMMQPVSLKLDDVVRDMEKMLRRLINEDISISLNLFAQETLVTIDPGQFEQVLINLIVNSRDAMPGGGKIKIGSSRVNVSEEKRMLLGSLMPGDYYLLSVEDNGEGISPDNISRIFDPFFSTKPEEIGTGLGLSMVYGIIKQSGGNILVNSCIGEGTSFMIYLPLTDQPEHKSESENISPSGRKGSGTILLVEDDSTVRSMVGQALTQHGFSVLTAENSREAIHISENTENNIDLLFSDYIMPHMNGDKLAETIKADRPDIRVLIMSGYPDKATAKKDFENRGWGFLFKPFDNYTLINTVNEILK